jgi:hypothetical protein
LKPWRFETFKLSTDPAFEDKLVDVVGLYMHPPQPAVVFSFDEKTQCQALHRSQPSLPMTHPAKVAAARPSASCNLARSKYAIT